MAEKRKYSRVEYIDGNVVRKLEAAPDYRREEEEKRRRALRRRNQHVARRNRERALKMNRGYVAFLSFAAMVTAFVSVVYIQLQSDLTGRLRNISALESQISDLRADNDALLKRIDTSVNLEAVKEAAIHQLGMVYAGADQIIYYSVENDDYMSQYKDIPRN